MEVKNRLRKIEGGEKEHEEKGPKKLGLKQEGHKRENKRKRGNKA